MQHNLAIGVLFFERAEQTLQCLRDIAPAGKPIYVLNNGSSPESTAKLRAGLNDLPSVTLLDSPTNLGVAAGRNRLVAETREPWLLFLDSDLRIPDTQWLTHFERARRDYPSVEAFVPKLHLFPDDELSLTYRFLVQDGELLCESVDGAAPTNGFPGGAAFVARSLFERLGPYDEAMFVGFEDYEYAVRGIATGAPILGQVLPAITFLHCHEPAQCREDRDAARTRYHADHLERSFQHFTQKWNVRYTANWRQWVDAQVATIDATEVP